MLIPGCNNQTFNVLRTNHTKRQALILDACLSGD